MEKGAKIDWFTAPEDGRLIFKVSTVSPRAIWGIQTIIHHEETYVIENPNDITRITGHGEISFSSEISHGQAVKFSNIPGIVSEIKRIHQWQFYCQTDSSTGEHHDGIILWLNQIQY